jgi:ATP-dependent Clp protease ATP-binding subunit ClpA
MSDISIGLDLAWQIAVAEAALSRHELIEPAHLCIGLCSLEKQLLPEVRKQLQLPDNMAQSLWAEWDALAVLFAQFGIEPTIRRTLRERLGRGKCTDTNRRKRSRSPASHAAFARAEALAAGASPVTVLHLLAALLDDTSGLVVALLKDKSVDVAALRTAALAASVSAQGAMAQTLPLLETYGKDLVQLTRDGEIHACISRRHEILH